LEARVPYGPEVYFGPKNMIGVRVPYGPEVYFGPKNIIGIRKITLSKVIIQ